MREGRRGRGVSKPTTPRAAGVQQLCKLEMSKQAITYKTAG